MYCLCNALGIVAVDYAVVAKGNIADSHIHIVVRNIGGLKALYADIRLRVQIFCDKAGDAVKLDHCPARHLRAHADGHTADKVTNAGGGLKHAATLKAELVKAVIHSLYNLDGGVVRILCAGAHALIFLFGNNAVGHKLPELLKLLFPAGLSHHFASVRLAVISQLAKSV